MTRSQLIVELFLEGKSVEEISTIIRRGFGMEPGEVKEEIESILRRTMQRWKPKKQKHGGRK